MIDQSRSYADKRIGRSKRDLLERSRLYCFVVFMVGFDLGTLELD